ncbi:MAG: DUF5399 family protein [Chlamydiota bacterium]
MKAVTIDNFDIKAHEQYARDQLTFDPTFIVDAAELSPHFDTGGTSAIYSSKWEKLFELGIRNTPWALFSAPLSFKTHCNRYFHIQILPSLEESLEDQENKDDENEPQEKAEILKKILKTKKNKQQTHETFEKERSTLINFFDSVKVLDKLLSYINARKICQQKG